MIRRFSVNFAILSMLIDMGLISLSLYAATQLRPILNSLPFTQVIDLPVNLPVLLYPFFAISWVVILQLFSVYDGRRNLRLADELSSISLGSILAGVALAGTLYLSYREISRVLYLSFVLIASSFIITWRFIIRLVFRIKNQSTNLVYRVLIIGAGPVGRELSNKILQYPFLRPKVVGFLDDDEEKRANHHDIIGPIDGVRDIVKQQSVNNVVIALPRRAHERVNQLVAELHDLPVSVWVIPDYFHLALHKATVEEFAGIPLLDLRAPALNEYQRMIKRVFDLLITLVCMPVIILLMGVIAVAIWLEGSGPIILKQNRIGENGNIFGMYKFRTMIPNADELQESVSHVDSDGNTVFKSPSDPRVTRIGKLLRRTSLDELPQFINIIKGEMSLVGPRPELPYLVNKYQYWQHKRFVVPQGLTGWWQVNGRSDKPMHLHTEDDIYYVQNYSLLLDIQILLRTIWVVFLGKGAY